MIAGTPKFSGLAILELNADIRATGQKLECKAAWVDTQRGSTHGWAKGDGAIWSKETIERLLALVDSMEADMAVLHFQEVSGNLRLGATERPLADPGGIGEHLVEADQA